MAVLSSQFRFIVFQNGDVDIVSKQTDDETNGKFGNTD